MATNKNSTSKYKQLPYTHAEISSQRVGESEREPWQIRCLNSTGHRRGDRNPSAYYYPSTGYYGCHTCGISGYTKNRSRPDYHNRKYEYSNGDVVYRKRESNGRKRIWQQQATTSRELPNPFGYELLHERLKQIYIVEGERCVELFREHLDLRTQAVITSKQGSKSPHKTNWSSVSKATEEGCEIVFLPDRDNAGEEYMHAIANLVGINKINVIRLGGDRDDGYDIANWLDEGNIIEDLPKPTVEQNLSLQPVEQLGFIDLFGYHEPDELMWLADGMIPSRKLTVIVGRAGIGKSTMALYIASAISQGIQPFLSTPLLHHKGLFNKANHVLIYTSEDDWNDTIAVRLLLHGAKLDCIAPLRNQRDPKLSFDWSGHRPKTENGDYLLSDLELLIKNLRHNPVTLLVIDPLLDIIAGRNNNDPAQIRYAIETKINPILATGCTVIGVHHERKDARKEDLLIDRAVGSQAWTAVARSVLHMQALPKRKALGSGKTPKPRESLDKKYNIQHRHLNTNSEVCGAIVVSKSNLARVDGGYHYELPTSIPEGQSSSFIQVAVNLKKIINQTPEQIVQIYNPVAQDKIESAFNRKARSDMARQISAVKIAESVVEGLFINAESYRIPTNDLIQQIQEAAGVGIRNAREAMHKTTTSEREGKSYYRIFKQKNEKSA